MTGAGDSSLGGGAFPPTRWSIILDAGDANAEARRRALDELCRLYWKPVYAYIRAVRRVERHEAKDLTQDFFVEVMEGNLLSRASPEKGTFRGYLRGALHLFLLEQRRQAGALKRGGGRRTLTLDDDEVRRIDQLTAAPGATPEQAFDRQWMHSVIDIAVQDLRDEMARTGREIYFRVFDRHQLHPPAGDPPSHAQLAREFTLRESDVNHYLAECRRKLRECISGRIRDYVSSPGEVEEEVRGLFSA